MIRLLAVAAGVLAITAGCARSQPVPAEADDIEAAVNFADENATSAKAESGDRASQR
jgi:ActR/RegA family two-component response regulator